MKPLTEYDKKGILAEEVFVEIFEQEDAIRRSFPLRERGLKRLPCRYTRHSGTGRSPFGNVD